MSIVLMKLCSGEEIIADEVYGELSAKYKRPRVLQVMQQQNGQMGAALVPWMIADQDGTFPIDAIHIITKVDAPSEIEKVYLQQTSGIALTGTF